MSRENGHWVHKMSIFEHIRQNIDQEVFTYTQLLEHLKDYKKPRDGISSLLKKGYIIRIRKGLYIFDARWRKKKVNPEILANLIYGPSIISTDYALSLYSLIPEGVTTITSITTGRSRIYETPVGRYTYEHIDVKRFSYGANIKKTDAGTWFISGPLKALADKVWLDKRFNPTSPSSYSEYLFNDLRIDETVLKGLPDSIDKLNELDKVYSSRKITWLIKFLTEKIFPDQKS